MKNSDYKSEKYLHLSQVPESVLNHDLAEEYLRYLTENNLVELESRTNMAGEEVYLRSNFKINQNGIEYFKWRWEEQKKFLLKSIFVPVLVAIATSLLTTAIIYWFGKTF
ncbi:hypothetical protein QMA56_05135 [Leuconostoc falkenbergense]|uniref:hypothetical protein n=1 Tax=Leuconostoc falkenbergense TaxID=2766470 RepID=UPI0024AD09EC|nr:hypothetical protein [Leuconostoc falkenbergense]MDI6667093.1 hypothetical protein [Leuconostoc falkenbergense]